MSHNVLMLTRDQLAEWLKTQNVEALASSTGLSAKTIYRLRWNKTRPSFGTLEALVRAGAAAPVVAADVAPAASPAEA